jgi:hypothetical protein
MKNQIHQQVHLSAMATQAKARSINEGIKTGMAKSKPSSWQTTAFWKVQGTAGLIGSSIVCFGRFKERLV